MAPAPATRAPAASPLSALASRPAAELVELAAKRQQMLQAAAEATLGRSPTAASADEAWDDPSVPAGSAFSAEEWARARSIGSTGKGPTPVDSGRRPIVFELRTSLQTCLVLCERAPEPPSRIVIRDGVAIKEVDDLAPEVAAAYLDPLQELLLDDCLVLGPKAPTTHPAAVSGELSLRGLEWKDWSYRIVRPESHRQTQPFLFGARGWIDAPLGPPLARDEPEAEAAEGVEAQEQRPRMGGA